MIAEASGPSEARFLSGLELGEQHLPLGAVNADQPPGLRIDRNALAREG